MGIAAIRQLDIPILWRALGQMGTNDSTQQGEFDLSGIPLPPGVSSANYQVTFEAIDPLFILQNSVGPYHDGQVTVCHEHETWKERRVRNCLSDEGRPFGVGLQEQAPNHLRRLWP